MTRELFNLAELLGAHLIGVFVGGVAVFLATVWMRNDAAADRIVAADDAAKVAAGLVRMESARQLLPLAPAYAAMTAEYRMVEPVPDAPVEETVPVSELDDLLMPDFVPGQPLPDADGTGTALVLAVDEPPVTADDLAPIGPDRVPQVPRWVLAALAIASPLLLAVLVLLAIAALVWLGADRTAEWWADRRRRRDAEAVEIVMAHPAPATKYKARHSAVKR